MKIKIHLCQGPRIVLGFLLVFIIVAFILGANKISLIETLSLLTQTKARKAIQDFWTKLRRHTRCRFSRASAAATANGSPRG